MPTIQMMITTAGLAALVDAQNGSTEAIEIVSMGVTATPFIMAPTLTGLPGEFKRLDAISGQATSETIIHMTGQDVSTDVYDVRGIGLYLADGTLFGVYGQADPIFRKVGISFFLFALDLVFQNSVSDNIVFGDTSFLMPPASETVKGVAEIATPAEAAGRTDHGRIITPLTLGLELDTERGKTNADLLEERAKTDSDLIALSNLFDGKLVAERTETDGDLTALSNLFDGKLVAERTETDGDLTALSNLFDGKLAAERTETDGDLTALSEAFDALLAALVARTITGGGLVGGGGNLTASRVLTVLAASAADVAAGAATDRAITPAALSGLGRSLAQNGYAILPGLGGLILQWGRFTASANGNTTTLFPIAFPTQCFAVTGWGGTGGNNDSQDNPPVLIASGIERSGFAVFSADDSAGTCAYIALGI